jgi:phosphoribosylaminoimidazole-succinocarboxamide synthase
MSWKLIRKGKVRDIYVNDDLGLIALVATDRVSAFDSVLPVLIEGKGEVLTSISNHYAIMTSDIPNAYIWDLDIIEAFCRETGIEQSRVTLQRKTIPLPSENIVRGFMTGSVWRDYSEKAKREKCGVLLPEGLVEGQQFSEPMFGPSTKSTIKDEDITFEQMVKIYKDAGYDERIASYVREKSLSIYNRISEFASSRGLIFVDSKFEFGYEPKTGQILVIDEIGTPDSSRYWMKGLYVPGKKQEGYDKELIRQDIMSKRKLGIPDDQITVDEQIVAITIERYRQVERIIVG